MQFCNKKREYFYLIARIVQSVREQYYHLNDGETGKRGKRESGWLWYRTGKVDKSINDTIIIFNLIINSLILSRFQTIPTPRFPVSPFLSEILS